MVMCLPSSAYIRDRVGERIGTRRVEMFGNALRYVTLAGDGCRTKHDRHKMEIMGLLGWCSLVASFEVTGLFAHLVPQEELVGEEGQGVRQVMVPDF